MDNFLLDRLGHYYYEIVSLADRALESKLARDGGLFGGGKFGQMLEYVLLGS